MEKSVSIEELSNIFEVLLASHPSRAGKRLRSERELSKLLKIDRMKVQKSFDLLMEKKILLRRHGSGTFVRKVPRPLPGSAQPQLGGQILEPHVLFASVADKMSRRQYHPEHRTLDLSIVPNKRWKSNANCRISEGIDDRILQNGHNLEILQSGRTSNGQSDEDLIAKLRASQSDGFILWTTYSDVLDRAFPEARPPVIFIGAMEREADINCSPLIRIDLEDASIRGLRLLAKEGYRRIGFIGFASIERDWKQDRHLYEGVMTELGIPFRSIEFCSLADGNALEVVQRMFAPENRPDAVYVADDIVLGQLAPIWKEAGIIPGKNLGVITLSVFGNKLPRGFEWSHLEVNPFQVGRMAVDSLALEIETAGEQACSFEHLAEWHAGKTHQKA